MTASTTSVLEVSREGPRSLVTRALAHAPLKLLNPSNHGTGAWVFQSSYGGGFVRDDQVRLDVTVKAGAQLFLSSQAASKVYRGTDATFQLEATVEPAALLVSWPDPLVCFEGASFDQRQRFALADPSAAVVALDVLWSGRASRGERWRFAAHQSRLQLDLGGQRVLDEALRLTPQAGPLVDRLGDFDALGTVVLAGEACAALASELEAACRARPLTPELLLVTSRTAHALVLRAAARHPQRLSDALRELLGPAVARWLGDDPLRRKW